jgi:uncharacterized membrane protein HdeD (DUF308 family)
MNGNYHLALRQLKDNWFWYLVLGISLVVIGTFAIIYSVASTIFSIMYLGGLLIVFGFVESFKSFKISKWSTFFLHLLLGIALIFGGFFILTHPLINALTLTLFFAIAFIVFGALKIGFSLFGDLPHKGFLFLNGLISLILGILLWQQWPISGLWAIGTFVGIDAIFTGWTWIFLSFKAKNLRVNSH